MAEYKFSDVFEDVTRKGRKIPANQYLLEGKYPIIDQGKEDVGGYTNAQDGLFTNVPAIIFGDHTRIIKYVDEPFFIGADGVKILEKKVVGADYKYLFYALTHAHIPNTGYNRHFKFLKEVSIPIPDIADQCKIVQQLDLLSSIIDKQLKSLKIYDNLVKSRFIEMFGDINMNTKNWPIKPLGELCDIYRGGSPRPINKFLGGDVPWIKIGDATQGDEIYLHSTKEHIIKDGVKKSRMVKSGSLIFANCGVSLGFARIITFDGCIHDGWLAFEDVDESLDKVFLLLSLNQLTEYFRAIAPDGTQPNLNTAIMKMHQQIIPPIKLQRQFVEFVRQADKSKLSIQQSIETLQTLKAKLMQEYFG